jgi:hypothetical protein
VRADTRRAGKRVAEPPPGRLNAECPDGCAKRLGVRFDAIVVPRGAEARAVERGWPLPRPALLAVPAGAAAGNRVNDGRPAVTAVMLGLCGAIDPALRVGETVVYGRIIDGSEIIELDGPLAHGCAAAFGCAPLTAANVARVVGAPAEKATLRASSGAAVIDMEGAAVARALHRRGIRVAMVRVVSDDAQSVLPDLHDAYDAGGTLRNTVLIRAFAREPLRSARFARNALRALRALRSSAERLALTASGSSMRDR